MRIIALFNQKGGVGKTTSAANIGAGLAKLGRRVLLIDIDPQASLTISLGLPEDGKKTISEVLAGEIPLAQAIKERDGLQVIPSGIQLATAELVLAGELGREMLLTEALAEYPGAADFDYILIDCPPSLQLMTINALTAAQEIIIPIQAEFLPLEGLKALLKTVTVIKKRLNPELRISGVLVTFHDPRKTLQRQVTERIDEQFGDRVFNTKIRVNIALAEAQSHFQTIFEYQPQSNGAADYMSLCNEIISREGR